MEVLIVAIDHELQLVPEANDPSERRIQKTLLYALLKTEIIERRVQFVAEESDPNKTTIALTLANEMRPRIPWKNIMMTQAEREAAGIKEAMDNRPGHPDATMEWWIECRIPEDQIRETFFIDQALEGARGLQSILLLLGDMHVEVVDARLAIMGHMVATNHDLVPVKRWEDKRLGS